MKHYTFIKPDPNLKNNLMAFGYECGQGWYPLIEELFDKIQLMIDHDPDLYRDFEILQVKEKWGELVIYCNYAYSEIQDLIDLYHNRSKTTCERCGKAGIIRNIRGWYTCICDECLIMA